MMRIRQLHCRANVRLDRYVRGFTFTETMVALLIFVLLSAFVANGIPIAFKTYQQVVNSSNAQVALSTTTSALRDELGLATAVQTNGAGKVLYYQSPEGYWVQISNPTNNKKGLQKHLFNDSEKGPDSSSEITDMSLIPESMIVGAVGTSGLKVKMDEGGITYNSEKGVFSISGLEVVDAAQESNVVEDISDENGYQVRAVLKPKVIRPFGGS